MTWFLEEEQNLKTQALPKIVTEYLKKFSISEEEIVFNIFLRDKYGTIEKLCEKCIEENKTIQQLEPMRSRNYT